MNEKKALMALQFYDTSTRFLREEFRDSAVKESLTKIMKNLKEAEPSP